jgi:hypothetical protein
MEYIALSTDLCEICDIIKEINVTLITVYLLMKLDS